MAVPPPAAAAAATGSKVRGSDRRLFTQGDGGQLRGMSHVKAVTRQRPVPAVCMHSVCMPRCQAVQPAAASTPSTAAQEKVSMDPRAALAAELRAMIEEKVRHCSCAPFLICPRAESAMPFCVVLVGMPIHQTSFIRGHELDRFETNNTTVRAAAPHPRLTHKVNRVVSFIR